MQHIDGFRCVSRRVRTADGAEGVADDRLEAAYAEHREALVRLATLLTGDAALAEDLVHDAFLASRDALARLGRPETYVYLRSAVVNGWRNVLRHRRVVERREPDLWEGPPATGDATDQLAEHDRLWREIDRLPGRQRGVVVLRYYEDLPDRDIARLLGCSRVTVRSQAKRALDKLREVIEG